MESFAERAKLIVIRTLCVGVLIADGIRLFGANHFLNTPGREIINTGVVLTGLIALGILWATRNNQG